MNNLKDKKIGCIGIGNMGSAITAGLVDKILIDNINIIDTDKQKLDELSKKYKIKSSKTIEALVNDSDIIIIAVKPNIVAEIVEQIGQDIKNKIIVSIAAGISISTIENKIGSNKKIIRAMPNTPALINEGITVLAPNKNIDDGTLKTVKEIFSQIGKVHVLPENLMDAVTGLSGSGPAYVFTFIQAMADGGVKMGIPRDIALDLAVQTVIGSAKMIQTGSESPFDLRGKVTSPAGTTIEAVHVLEKGGFSGLVMDAIESATNKSKIMG